MTVEKFILKINDRVVIAYRGRQQSLRVFRRRRQDDFQPRRVSEPRFRILRVVRPRVYPSARRPAKHDRHRYAPSVIALRRVVHYLIEGAGDEVNELKFYDGAKPYGRRRARRAYKTRLADRRINDAVRAELFEKTLSDLKRAAERAYVFAEHEHAWVAPHLAPER